MRVYMYMYVLYLPVFVSEEHVFASIFSLFSYVSLTGTCICSDVVHVPLLT